MIDPIFNMFKVKFERLDKMNIVNKQSSKIVVYINLEMVFRYLYTARVDTFLAATGTDADTQICIMSNIINLAQHYRLYFAKMHKDAEVVLYCTDTSMEPAFINYKYNPSYRNHYINKTERNGTTRYINSRVNAIWKPLDIIMTYVNGVYLIRSHIVEPSLIPYVLQVSDGFADNKTQHIIVSTFLYDMQYIGRNSTMIYPDRENSVYLTKDNVGEFIKDSKKCKNPTKLYAQFIPFVLSITGDKYRSIPSIPGLGLSKSLRMLQDGIDGWKITTDTSTMQILVDLLPDEIKDQFMANFNTIDVIKQYSQLSPLDIESVTSKIVNKYDDYSLNLMNEKYFTQHPLMLVNSAREQVYKDNNTKRNVFDK